MELPTLELRPIGIIRTPYTDRVDAPRQPGVFAEGATGKIILEAGKNFEQALEDLEGFEKIWLIYQFNRNSNWNPKVLPPRGDRTKRGVFATRSPHRPNPIGLSLVTLLEIDGRNIYVGGVDILDNTPIFDIKPYLPYAEAFPDAKMGWLDETISAENSNPPFTLEISEVANEQLKWLDTNQSIQLLLIARRILESDPFPHPSKRITKRERGYFTLAIKSWRILYRIEGNIISIHKVKSGYSAKALEAGSEGIHQKEAHEAFHKLWG
jgi:tRNA-Thr(GGU) m(6)t(6)A37 methyltransferase TsaA